MRKLAILLAAVGVFAFAIPASPVHAGQSYEARVTASAASRSAHEDMMATFGTDSVEPGHYLWRDNPDASGEERVVISLGDQLAYLYKGDSMIAVAAISTGREGHESPAGVFQVLGKTPMYHSKKYDNAPMPWAEMITDYVVALHAGPNPGYPASHGCIRLPIGFAKKLYSVTDVGTPVLLGA